MTWTVGRGRQNATPPHIYSVATLLLSHSMRVPCAPTAASCAASVRSRATRAAVTMQAASAAEPARLYYFHGRGRAEQSRWVLAAAEVPFVNMCLSTSAEFAALKRQGKLIFGQVPLLELDGLRLVQSQAILRHVARTRNIAGADEREQALADQLAEACSDFRSALLGLPFNGNTQACASAVQRYAPIFESLLSESRQWVAAGQGMTYADALLAEAVTGYSELFGDAWLSELPRLKAHRDRVCALPGVAAYLSSPLRFPFPAGKVAEKYVQNVSTVLS